MINNKKKKQKKQYLIVIFIYMVNFINRQTVDIRVIIAHLKMEKFSFFFSLFSPVVPIMFTKNT